MYVVGTIGILTARILCDPLCTVFLFFHFPILWRKGYILCYNLLLCCSVVGGGSILAQ